MGEKVVGHKSMIDGSHEPLYESEAREILAACEAADKRRKGLMPDSMSAIEMLHDAQTRLKDEGWREGCYCPKNGTPFALIEFGSTGIFQGVYHGEWPNGHILAGDCVSSPHGVMWKALDKLTEDEREKLDRCLEMERQFIEREIAAFATPR